MKYPLIIDNASVEVQDGREVRKILDKVSLAVPSGTCVGIAGDSGSGKSTLLAVAGGLTTPTSGEVTIAGNNISHASTAEKAKIRRDHIGFIFQAPQLQNSLTVLENVMAVYYLDRIFPLPGHKKKEAKQRASDLIQRVGLEGRENAKPSELSGGQRARVGIARGLAKFPEVLLVDEPTASLDSTRAQEVTDLIQEVTHEMGVATLFVSHAADLLQQLDEVYVMRDGKLAKQ